MALTISPLIQYKPVHRHLSQIIKYITVKLITSTVTVRCVSPRAQEGEEKEVRNKVNQLCGRQAIVMGDLNASNRL